MKKNVAVSALVLAMGFTGHATAENGPYIGGNFGSVSVDLCKDAWNLGIPNCDDEDNGWKLYGGYAFNRNIAVEAGYAYLGEMSAGGFGVNGSVELDGFMASLKGSLPLNESVSLFARVGAIAWDAEGGGALSGFDDDGTDLTYGVGVEFALTENFGLLGEWERFDIDDEDVDLISLGARYSF